MASSSLRFSKQVLLTRTNVFARLFFMALLVWIIGISFAGLEILARIGGIVLVVFIAVWIAWIISRVMH